MDTSKTEWRQAQKGFPLLEINVCRVQENLKTIWLAAADTEMRGRLALIIDDIRIRALLQQKLCAAREAKFARDG